VLQQAADFLGKKFIMQINGLHECDYAVAASMGRIASIDAAVGIPGRTSLGGTPV